MQAALPRRRKQNPENWAAQVDDTYPIRKQPLTD